MSLIDGDARAKATCPQSSFIVQAPAGSGKTEILTQRYLRLLSKVSAPEQIIALTFTRKAASEMRERIVLALQQAASNKKAHSAHQQMTLDYATQALKHSTQYEWNLLQQPNRLKIITIDSLCQSINQAIPLLEQQIAYAQISEKPQKHYLNAARACIAFAIETPPYQDAIKTLLMHVDNKQEYVLSLFQTLLAQRDQWLSLLFQARNQEQSAFEEALQLIEQHELARFKKSLPLELGHRLVELVREVVLLENNPDSPRYLLNQWDNFQESNQDIAKALCYLLLGSDGSIRKGFDHHVGFKSDSCPKAQYKRIKEDSKELLMQLSEQPDFLAALLQVSRLPEPEYDAEQWEVLQSLFLLLPLLVGHLQILFSENNEVDFTAIAQQALSALGDVDEPTDLALYLDNAIHHLLVDEFQDTSITQFDLLTQLVQGWQQGDGKTLFIVGDPMQSIYRFRQAEVGLFFRAKVHGIGPVLLNSLELQCNFRSTQTIIQWVNTQFKYIFPQHVDIESGAVSFHASVDVLGDKPLSAVQALEFEDKEQEALHLISLIEHELEADSEQSIAILVRSRSQLSSIIELLRTHQIPYQGTDIDLLAHLSHIRDAWSITQALLMPGNRLAWLACLRSPYCGIALNDLHLIAQFNKKNSIYHNLLLLDKIQGLSEDAQQRARFFLNVMNTALSQRAQTHLSDWVSTTLKKLHCKAVLTPNQLNDLEQFWALLDKHEADGRIPDMNEFMEALNTLYSQQTTASRLQIMTIHKSKGLEFDTVFLPGLGTQPNKSNTPLLRWLKLPTQAQDNVLLVSPMKAAHHEHCALYDYLGQLDEEKSYYESQRLLYVAVTRAKSRLYLLDGSGRKSKKSFRGLLKNQDFISQKEQEQTMTQVCAYPKLARLPQEFYQNAEADERPFLNAGPQLSPAIPRLIGIVTHRLLQWICDKHPKNQEDIPWAMVMAEFKKLGVDKTTQESALATIKTQINGLFNDPIGLWLIAPHEEEHNEYELLVAHNQRLVTRIIDRTFVADNQLWIIDFKTGKEDKESQKKYKEQLNQYASYLSHKTKRPIQCGLYYLSNQHWSEWRAFEICGV